MSRYIDVDRIPFYVRDVGDRVSQYDIREIAFASEIKNMPTADVVEVVRCKDCKHRYSPSCALWYGTLGGIEYFIGRGDDFYCSFGEREDE